jgi:uncharacterized protein (DUF1015 family)
MGLNSSRHQRDVSSSPYDIIQEQEAMNNIIHQNNYQFQQQHLLDNQLHLHFLLY